MKHAASRAFCGHVDETSDPTVFSALSPLSMRSRFPVCVIKAAVIGIADQKIETGRFQ
jgi:hypothetical protein